MSSKQVSGDQSFRQSGAESIGRPEALKCPRCSSTNTKFCYYNNYNKSQPRHFCKSCKRHWTKGGTLRNVPVGGGRKSKRPKIAKAATRVPGQQDFSTAGQKNMLYQALIGRSCSSSPLLHEAKPTDNIASISACVNATATAPAPHIIPNTEFHFSSLLEPNPASYPPLNAFGNLDSVEESTITTVNLPSSSGAPWEGTSALDLPNYWNWNEIDVLTSGDLSISWDDQDQAAIKP